MRIELILYGVMPIIFLLAIVFGYVFPRRWRMERRARALLAKHPGAQRTSVYLALHSTWAGQKQQEMDAKIAEMNGLGWTFLRGMEANPLRTLLSWGGGINLQFIRTHSERKRA